MIHLETLAKNGKETDKVFGIYKSKLLSVVKERFSNEKNGADLTFSEVEGKILDPVDPLEDHEKNSVELKQFWGDNFEYDDYVWLEAEYAEWKEANSSINRSEETILKLVVLKLLAIRKAINANKDTSKLEEGLTKLLNTGALSPAQANVASQGKLVNTYGMIIKMIEEETPAEHYGGNYKLFDDFFDLKKYLRNYISRPITNFLGGEKNYEIDDTTDEPDIDDFNLDNNMNLMDGIIEDDNVEGE
jgi:hypothetical protein